jgi:hypothetical protein
MCKHWIFFILLFMRLFSLTASPLEKSSKKREKPPAIPLFEYEKSPYVADDAWEYVKPFLLPSNHPVKARLDKIFSKARVSLNENSLLEAGFERSQVRKYSNNIVSKHPELQGYLVKLFTDEQDVEDFPPLVCRIDGAQYVRNEIKAHGYEKLFSVPNKWIYPLPSEPSPPEGYHRKNFILVVEDMNIYTKRKNYLRWKEKMTPKRADAIYIVLQNVGLSDSIYPFNLPFCEDGRQAFIDTEHHHKWPVHFDLMLPFFSPKMEQHWRNIVGNGGPLKTKKISHVLRELQN